MNENTKADSAGNLWKRMSFKGNKVWVALGPDRQFQVKNNKVRIKYNLAQEYEYKVGKASLKPESQAVPAGCKKKKKNAHGGCQGKGVQGIDLPENCICIYTDGASSGNPGPSGIGVLLLYGRHRKEISKYIGHATNNIAELSAIGLALSKLKRFDLPVRIFTDSSYAIGVLTKDSPVLANPELVLKIRKQIKDFSNLELIKVKGHSGIKENEVADFLATSAIKKGP